MAFGIGTAIALGVTAAAEAFKAKSTAKAADAQERAGEIAGQAADAQAAQFEYNAEVADLQAQDALDRGADEESRFRSSVRGLIGSQRAAAAGNNVDVHVGSAVDVQADAAYLGELDAQQIKANAQRAAWGYREQAADLRMGAEVARRGGNAARLTGQVNASTTRSATKADLIGTGASLLMQRYGLK
jgi:hypothetical protein